MLRRSNSYNIDNFVRIWQKIAEKTNSRTKDSKTDRKHSMLGKMEFWRPSQGPNIVLKSVLETWGCILTNEILKQQN